MGRFVRLLIAVFFLAPITAMAQQDEIAVDLVECVNLANGHSIQLNEAAWELSQANLDLVYDQYLEGGYYFVRGRPLGWHGTWGAFVDLSTDAWRAFETRRKDDALTIVGASFVPEEVVNAFKECGVEWGGYWTEDYPVIEATGEVMETEPQVVAPWLVEEVPVYNPLDVSANE